MIYNDPTNEQGIVQEIDDICNSDNNSYPIKKKTRRVNQALSRYTTLALQTDGRWEEDDSTYDDYPIATRDLIENKIDYTFPEDIMEVFRVEVKNTDGKWVELIPIDQRDYKPQASDEFMKNPGNPMYYDKKYSSIWLYPATNYNLTNGLKLHFNRKLKDFIPTDTNKKPGIPSVFHPYLCRYASLPFLIEKAKKNKNDIAQLIQQDEAEIKKYYSRRDRDDKTRVLPRRNFTI